MDVLALLGIQQGKRGLVMPWLLWLVWSSISRQSDYSHDFSSFLPNKFHVSFVLLFSQVFAWGCHLCGCDCCLYGRSTTKTTVVMFSFYESIVEMSLAKTTTQCNTLIAMVIFHEKVNWCDVDSLIIFRYIQRPTTYYPCWARPSSQHLPGKQFFILISVKLFCIIITIGTKWGMSTETPLAPSTPKNP